MVTPTKNLQTYWATIRPILTIPKEREYDQAVKRLNRLFGARHNAREDTLLSSAD